MNFSQKKLIIQSGEFLYQLMQLFEVESMSPSHANRTSARIHPNDHMSISRPKRIPNITLKQTNNN